MRYRIACIVALLLSVSSTSRAQFPWQKPPSRSKKADLVVFYAQLRGMKKQDFDLAWDRKATRWGVLPIPSKINTKINHEIFRRFPESIELVDELYWNLGGDLDEITVLATSQAGPVGASKGPPAPDQLGSKSWPLFWTKQLKE